MPRKPTLSPTKLTTYLACPVKYKWTYIDARGKWYLRSKSYYSFGSSLHKALERFHNSSDVGVTTTQEAVAALEESWIDAGYSSSEEMAEALGIGREIIEKATVQHLQKRQGVKTLFVERQFRYDMDEFVLIGRLDRLDEYPNGDLEIVDYKSGRLGVTQEEVSEDVAMGIYQLLVRRKFPDQAVRATIMALRTGEEASASMSDEKLGEFESDIKALCVQVLYEDWDELTPVFKPLCPHCDFLPLCRKHPDFVEL
ncbi:PD-(D/E)XK nuclease family protein [soil metagenome]